MVLLSAFRACRCKGRKGGGGFLRGTAGGAF